MGLRYLSETEISKLVNESHLDNHPVPFKFNGFFFTSREIDPEGGPLVIKPVR